MDITEDHLGDDIYKINLSGRMDVEGVGRIETRLAGMAASPRMAIVVDMSAVPFVSSLGLRAILSNAKAVARRGGRFVLLAPQDHVRSVLASSGVDQLVPVCERLEDARAKASG